MPDNDPGDEDPFPTETGHPDQVNEVDETTDTGAPDDTDTLGEDEFADKTFDTSDVKESAE